MLTAIASFSCLILAAVSVFFYFKSRSAYINGFTAGQEDAYEIAYREGLHAGKFQQREELADFLKNASLEEVLREFGLTDEVKDYANRVALARLDSMMNSLKAATAEKVSISARLDNRQIIEAKALPAPDDDMPPTIVYDDADAPEYA